ncbi:hypothetical protein AAVH_30090 [Aphelenchoides avenae]|nr:hypothetical protein AAVH_30090 [Aphelenchus avenae]
MLGGCVALCVLVAFANAGDHYVDVNVKGTVKCEVHEKCDHPVEGMEIRTYFLPKGEQNGPESG